MIESEYGVACRIQAVARCNGGSSSSSSRRCHRIDVGISSSCAPAASFHNIRLSTFHGLCLHYVIRNTHVSVYTHISTPNMILYWLASSHITTPWKEVAIRNQLMVCKAWWLIGRFDAFHPNGRGFESRSSRHVWTLSKILQLPVALRRVSYCRERFWFWKAKAVRSAIEMDKYTTI